MATIATVFKKINNLSNSDYGNNIKNMYNSYEENIKFVKKHLALNNNKYKNELKTSYYELAFPNGCP